MAENEKDSVWGDIFFFFFIRLERRAKWVAKVSLHVAKSDTRNHSLEGETAVPPGKCFTP